MSVCPISLTPPGRVFPPVDLCLGTRPSQAAKFLPLEKARRSGAKARMAPAVTGPDRGPWKTRISAFSPVASLSRRCSSSILPSLHQLTATFRNRTIKMRLRYFNSVQATRGAYSHHLICLSLNKEK